MHWLQKAAQRDRLSPQAPVLQGSHKAVEDQRTPKPVGPSRVTEKRAAVVERPAVVEHASVVERPAVVKHASVAERPAVVELASPKAPGETGAFDGDLLHFALDHATPLALAEIGTADRHPASHPVVGAEMPADFTIPQPEIVLQRMLQAKRNRVSLSYSLGLNITADFKRFGNFPAANGGPGAATSGVDHNYDDGFNRVDITGNDHGGFLGSWYWGYQNPGQISGDTLVMRSASLAGGSDSNNNGGPQNGLELCYGRELGRAEKWRWGVEGAFGFTAVRIRDSRPLMANVNITRDTYALNGVIPPVAPYAGTFNGPGAIITDAPARSTETVSGGATITGWRQLEANLFAFKVGPYVELPLSARWALDFRGGLALVAVNSEFSYQETTAISGLGEVTSSARGSQSDLLVGAYAGGGISYAFNDNFGVLAGAQFQSVGEFSQTLNGRKAVLDLSKSIYVTIGLSYLY